MSHYVEECRREWKRLRVPDSVADEMAAELAADLEEAKADGALVEEVLGSGASDPRALAASWASERGVSDPRWQDKIPRSPGAIVGAAGLLLVLVAIGAAIAAFTLSSHSPVLPDTTSAPTATVVIIHVPDFTGLPEAAAITAARAAGLSSSTAVRKGTASPAGTVIGQIPAAGTSVAPGATVRLTVARH